MRLCGPDVAAASPTAAVAPGAEAAGAEAAGAEAEEKMQQGGEEKGQGALPDSAGLH